MSFIDTTLAVSTLLTTLSKCKYICRIDRIIFCHRSIIWRELGTCDINKGGGGRDREKKPWKKNFLNFNPPLPLRVFRMCSSWHCVNLLALDAKYKVEISLILFSHCQQFCPFYLFFTFKKLHLIFTGTYFFYFIIF